MIQNLTHRKTKMFGGDLRLQDVYTDLLPLTLHVGFNKYMFEQRIRSGLLHLSSRSRVCTWWLLHWQLYRLDSSVITGMLNRAL